MGFIYGIKYKYSRKSVENLFPYILAQAKVWDIHGSCMQPLDRNIQQSLSARMCGLRSAWMKHRPSKQSQCCIGKSCTLAFYRSTPLADTQQVFLTFLQILSWRSKIKDIVKYCIYQTMLFLGFISGKRIRFPGKWAKTLKNPGSLTSTQQVHGTSDWSLSQDVGKLLFGRFP